jgi:hypothetical protein
MPKTQFIDGQSLVTAAFLNKIYNTDGGHKHDGADADGHASKIDLRSEITAGPNGSVTIPVDTADLHVIQHDHAASGNAIIKTDALTLAGAPRDATRRAQAPLDRSLYVQNVVKAWAELTWNGTAWAVTNGYNIGASVVDSTIDSRDYEVALLDFSSIAGVVQATIHGGFDDTSTTGPRYSVRPEVDPGGALRWRGRWFDGSAWQDWRPSGPPVDTVTLVMTVF